MQRAIRDSALQVEDIACLHRALQNRSERGLQRHLACIGMQLDPSF